MQGCCVVNSVRSEPEAEVRVAPWTLGPTSPPAPPPHRSLSWQGCPHPRWRVPSVFLEIEGRFLWLRDAGFRDADRPPGLRARPVTPRDSWLHTYPRWHSMRGPKLDLGPKGRVHAGTGGQAEVEEGEGRGAARQGSDPLTCLLAAPRTNPPQATGPPSTHPRATGPWDPMCFGETWGHREHGPLREAWAVPLHPCALLPQHSVVTQRGKYSPTGVRAPAGGLSNRPAVQRAWWVRGRWTVGLCPLMNTWTNTEVGTANLCLRACEQPRSLTSEASTFTLGSPSSAGAQAAPCCCVRLGRAWGRAGVHPAGLSSPMTACRPVGCLSRRCRGPC
ncbi:uncharacterized protein LOC116645424 [Phoca vitulina]|uniref:uncharacterized protein LOC116645424 n=1 Tax=Phoca vitulina TaxID=9720 RepID=UPI0013965A85|nr:uncharacterized protein LOC116645424 [Phoca vitulina]